jgi:hypothetical protein
MFCFFILISEVVGGGTSRVQLLRFISREHGRPAPNLYFLASYQPDCILDGIFSVYLKSLLHY